MEGLEVYNGSTTGEINYGRRRREIHEIIFSIN